VTYISLLAVLQAVGCVCSVWFLLEHRPRHWRRIEAIDAMGFPLIVALVFARGLILTVLNTTAASRPLPNMVFSVAMLLIIDVLLVIKLVNFRRFVRLDRQQREQEETRAESQGP
jgi:membrane protein implicated in regulation of membrane protease activity